MENHTSIEANKQTCDDRERHKSGVVTDGKDHHRQLTTGILDRPPNQCTVTHRESGEADRRCDRTSTTPPFLGDDSVSLSRVESEHPKETFTEVEVVPVHQEGLHANLSAASQAFNRDATIVNSSHHHTPTRQSESPQQTSITPTSSSATRAIRQRPLTRATSDHTPRTTGIHAFFSPSRFKTFLNPFSSSSSSPADSRTADMIFSDKRATPGGPSRRRSTANGSASALTDYEAELTSKDRLKQKEAIRRLLSTKVRNDWSFEWPRLDSDAETTVVERDSNAVESDEGWAERDEWESGLSGDEVENGVAEEEVKEDGEENHEEPFDSKNLAVASNANHSTAEVRKVRRRRRELEEMRINEGMRCFVHRRNAWTGARYVRRTRRLRDTSSTDSAIGTASQSEDGENSHSIQSANDVFQDLITEIPLPAPILPPNMPLRQQMTSKAYYHIYDKIIIQGQTPICPINLSVIVSSCVSGWQRDGEWFPPTAKAPAGKSGLGSLGLSSMLGGEAGKKSRDRRASVVSWVRRDREREAANAGGNGNGAAGSAPRDKGVLRRSFQKVVGVLNGGNRRDSQTSVTSPISPTSPMAPGLEKVDTAKTNGSGATTVTSATGDVPDGPILPRPGSGKSQEREA